MSEGALGVERLNRWSPLIRLGAAGLAVVYVALRRDELPAGHEPFAWLTCLLFGLAAIALLVALRRTDEVRHPRLDLAALAVDVFAVFAFILLFASDPGQPLRSLVFLVVVEAGLRFGPRGGIGVAVLFLPLLLAAELWRVLRFDYDFQPESIVVRMGLVLLIGTVVGQLASELVGERRPALARAKEAERLRDQLGRRVDLLEAANRCARALGSSLVLEQASQAFSRELRGLVPFDRMAIVLAEDEPRVITDTEPSSGLPRSLLVPALEGRLAVHQDLAGSADTDERSLAEAGLRCLLAAPLLVGARAIGVLVMARSRPRSFTPEETELVSLLGRLVATAVQNIRAYEAERDTAEEFRRLSALRADFVSLVSHELRSPLAAAIGSAITLRERWQQLTQPQRESFLSLIVDETRRCATLVGDVLDTSRIEGGTFTYQFADVDVAALVQDAVAAADVGQDRVRVTASIQSELPPVRGDRERLRQVLANLIDNAVKYSPPTEAVEVSALRRDGRVLVEVTDRGPGVSPEAQSLIFEKFGRAPAGAGGKPGTGLGLFIARSIAEVHGGSLEVRPGPRSGATFTLTLPA